MSCILGSDAERQQNCHVKLRRGVLRSWHCFCEVFSFPYIRGNLEGFVKNQIRAVKFGGTSVVNIESIRCCIEVVRTAVDIKISTV
ncbi:hypothetical protein IB642_06930 [Allofrancisella guangzhouensis]|uniref:Uncharacterized protein n=1 Tax=Allofrancisella guangzhouensis TaxID=594679 RepID=A0A0A8E3T4_9GAMM|nr:hypothetical protein SD28_02755 [Allofrancisella guangzhouensis]MBK2026969.1 hypothetical protein [Allofrancisella guangzhouensis]MBK2044751.1 hypothetical protein [Allofrancisella guangzhouensis]MBK2045865.1 hypothetical protein [Allofrancisella guangzhouensis]